VDEQQLTSIMAECRIVDERNKKLEVVATRARTFLLAAKSSDVDEVELTMRGLNTALDDVGMGVPELFEEEE
jgi:hypothetical protein